MGTAVIQNDALDMVGIAMVVLGIGILALPVACVIYVIYKVLDNR